MRSIKLLYLISLLIVFVSCKKEEQEGIIPEDIIPPDTNVYLEYNPYFPIDTNDL